MPEGPEGLTGSLTTGRREWFDARPADRFDFRGIARLTLTLWKGKRMTRPTPLPGRRVRGSQTGRPIMALLDLLGRRWALRVLWELRDGSSPTFRQLQQRCGGISSSVLADRLRELGQADLVENAGDGYLLTEQGRTLRESLAPLDDWASGWQPKASD